jgi:hypothetical protein
MIRVRDIGECFVTRENARHFFPESQFTYHNSKSQKNIMKSANRSPQEARSTQKSYTTARIKQKKNRMAEKIKIQKYKILKDIINDNYNRKGNKKNKGKANDGYVL